MKFIFIGHMSTKKPYRCFNPMAKGDHNMCYIVFHISSFYYEKENLPRLSPPVDDEKSRESESKQEH